MRVTTKNGIEIPVHNPPKAPADQRAGRPAPHKQLNARPAATPAHPDIRPGIRGRNGEILRRNNRFNNQPDQFDVPTYLKEAGWDLQWNRISVLGKPDTNHMSGMMENGWTPVPASRAPGYFHPEGYTGAIEREGQILCERPIELTREAIQDGVRAARGLQQDQNDSFNGYRRTNRILSETGGAGAGFVPADQAHDSRGLAPTKVGQTIEGVPGNLYPARELALGDED